MGMCQLHAVFTAAPCFQVVSTTPGASSCPGRPKCRHRAWGSRGQGCVERCPWSDTIGICIVPFYPGGMSGGKPNADQEEASFGDRAVFTLLTIINVAVCCCSVWTLRVSPPPPSQVSPSESLMTGFPSPYWSLVAVISTPLKKSTPNFHGFVSLCVCTCINIHMLRYMCVWRSEVNIGCHSPKVISFYLS